MLHEVKLISIKKELISHSCLSLNIIIGNKFVESCSKIIVGIPRLSNMKQIAKQPNLCGFHPAYLNFESLCDLN